MPTTSGICLQWPTFAPFSAQFEFKANNDSTLWVSATGLQLRIQLNSDVEIMGTGGAQDPSFRQLQPRGP
jgi:hypothetical protein